MKEEKILCPECNGDKFNMTVTELGSFNIECVNCGYSYLTGSGVTVGSLIELLGGIK